MGQDFLNLCLSAYQSFLNPYLNESALRDELQIWSFSLFLLIIWQWNTLFSFVNLHLCNLWNKIVFQKIKLETDLVPEFPKWGVLMQQFSLEYKNS